MNGTTPLHLELEREIADWTGDEDALVFTTGYQANVGCVATLLGPEDTVIVDSGDHASIMDAVMMSRARIRPFRHNKLDKLEKMLDRSASDGGGVLVVVDGVFSMEGDLAPLPEIVELCRALRRPPDGGRGPRRRRAGRRRAPAPARCSAWPTGWTCGWAPSPSRWPPAAASSPAPAR